jgi:hypothetical protein
LRRAERVEDTPVRDLLAAEAMILTGERTALEYLLDPFRDSFARAFREK